jgi:site-specific DNA-methyltransferase (adenine-specific)
MKDLKNKIIQGDCLEKLKELEDKSIDMVLTDIPYGEVNRTSNGLRNLDKGVADVFDFSLEEMVNEFCRVTKGSMYVFCGTEQVSEIRKQMVLNGLSTRLVIWNKTNPSPMNGQHIWLSSIECCVYGKFKNATFNEHCKGSVLNFPSGRGKVHPTEKPLKLFEYIISVSSNKNDIILDPFMGSGTTGVACKNLNRNFIGIELDPEYFKIAEKRINENDTRKLI